MSDIGCTSLTKYVDGKLRFDHDILSMFFKNEVFNNRRIAIISIAGAMRTGKSFMLNFFIRYFENEGWENENWIGNGETAATRGFHWRGGKDPDTMGIAVWDRVYVVKKSDGQEIAVVLMDTQGLFDMNTTRANNVKLFTLSTIASSTQIMNINHLIQERDLHNLHFCVDFAKAALDKNCSDLMQLQFLMILVRDWVNAEDNPYGFSGGESYLDIVLQEQPEGSELNEVRKFLRQTFHRLGCFLMPHPGMTATKTKIFRGANKDLEEDFLEFVKKLCEDILNPDKIEIKMSDGEPMTARKLVNELTACDDVFAGDDLPPIETVIEMQAKVHYMEASQVCIDMYNSEIKNSIENDTVIQTISGMEQFEKTHAAALEKSIKKYKSYRNIGSKKYRSQYKEDLKAQCKRFYENWKEQLQVAWNAAENDLRSIVNEVENDYGADMAKVFEKKSLPDGNFRLKNEELSAKYLEIFDNKTSKFGQRAQSHRVNLTEKLERCFLTKQRENKQKREMEDKLKDETDQLKLFELKENLCSEFARSMQKIKKFMEEEDLDSKHKDLTEKALGKYNAETRGVKQDIKIKYQHLLESKLEEERQKSQEVNFERKEVLEEKLKNMADKLAAEYKKEMLLDMKEVYMAEEVLRKSHEEKRKEKLEELEAIAVGGIDLGESRTCLLYNIKIIYNELRQINNINKEKRNMKIENFKDASLWLGRKVKESLPYAVGLIARNLRKI